MEIKWTFGYFVVLYWAPLHCPALFILRDAALNNILVKQSFSFVSPEALKCAIISYLVLKSPFRVCLGQLRRLKMVTKAVLFLTLLESIL